MCLQALGKYSTFLKISFDTLCNANFSQIVIIGINIPCEVTTVIFVVSRESLINLSCQYFKSESEKNRLLLEIPIHSIPLSFPVVMD